MKAKGVADLHITQQFARASLVGTKLYRACIGVNKRIMSHSKVAILDCLFVYFHYQNITSFPNSQLQIAKDTYIFTSVKYLYYVPFVMNWKVPGIP